MEVAASSSVAFWGHLSEPRESEMQVVIQESIDYVSKCQMAMCEVEFL